MAPSAGWRGGFGEYLMGIAPGHNLPRVAVSHRVHILERHPYGLKKLEFEEEKTRNLPVQHKMTLNESNR